MKNLFAFIFTCCSISAVHSQIPQRLSIGIFGGSNTPTNIQIEGEQPDNFKSLRTHDSSKGVFLQYELPNNFYVRSSFKKAALNLEYSYETLTAGSGYGTGFENNQYELGFGYRKNIIKALSFTTSLGTTYVDFKRRSLSDRSAAPAGNYLVKLGVDQVKEKVVLLNGALGLEYKTPRENAILLELAYYKGFCTAWKYNFKMDAYPDQPPYKISFAPSLQTKGDYAEVRIGYRMPIQKFVNLYTAIKNPKPNPDPDSLMLRHNTGIYWGLGFGREMFYTHQEQKFPDHTIKMRNADLKPSLSYFMGYRFGSGLMLEGGLRVGKNSITIDASDLFGAGGNWSLLMFTTSGSVKYAFPLWRDKLYLVPETGLQLNYADGVGISDSYENLGTIRSYSNILWHTKGFGDDYYTGYHAGLSLNGRVGKTLELGLGYRFSDSFSQKPVAKHEFTYAYNGIPQPAIVAKSTLQNDAFTISFRKFLRK